MLDVEDFRKFALSFDETIEQTHFERPSFRVNKKIFATLDLKDNNAVLKLSEIDQSVFCSLLESKIYPVKGTWGKQGWTIFQLNSVQKELLLDALTLSYCQVAPKRLAERYSSQLK